MMSPFWCKLRDENGKAWLTFVNNVLLHIVVYVIVIAVIVVIHFVFMCKVLDRSLCVP